MMFDNWLRARRTAANTTHAETTKEPRMAAPVQLPDRLVDRADIFHLAEGETAFTLPWSIMVDEDMRVWINGAYPVTPERYGTSSMLIRRTADGVEVLHGMEPQRPTRGLPWVGSAPSDLLPVVAIR